MGDRYITTITSDEIIELFKMDESDFHKALDKLVDRILTEYQTKLLLKYLKEKGEEHEM